MPKNDGFCTMFFSALANPLRVRMLQELALSPMTVNNLAKSLGAERTLVSHNLSMLNKAQLVSFRKDGKTRIYTANDKIVPHIFHMMERMVCTDCSIRGTCMQLRKRDAMFLSGRMKRPPCPCSR